MYFKMSLSPAIRVCFFLMLFDYTKATREQPVLEEFHTILYIITSCFSGRSDKKYSHKNTKFSQFFSHNDCVTD